MPRPLPGGFEGLEQAEALRDSRLASSAQEAGTCAAIGPYRSTYLLVR